jgi:hypothetical protein
LNKVIKVKHVVKGWEKKYGYLGVTLTERDLFRPLMNTHFTLNFLGDDLPNRTYSQRYKRIYVGKKIKELQVGDVLTCYTDERGNLYVKRNRL